MQSHDALTPESPSQPQGDAPAARRAWLSPVGIVLGIFFVVSAAVLLFLRLELNGTEVIVTNVGDRPVEGIVLLAVSETGLEVRDEWPIGTLRPGASRRGEHVNSSDTNLAVRLQATDGSTLDDRTRIYLGSHKTQRVHVDVTSKGVQRARHSLSGTEYIIEAEGIQRGLHHGR